MKTTAVFALVLLVCHVSVGMVDVAAALAELKADVALLKTHAQVHKVTFSASLVSGDEKTLGPFNTHTPMRFKYVPTNIGNAYNPDTGIFTAPVKGVYQFQWYVGAQGDGPNTAVALIKGSEVIFSALEEQTNGYQSSSQGVSLILEAGDTVFLRLWKGSRVYDNGNHHTTFSGNLLYTM